MTRTSADKLGKCTLCRRRGCRPGRPLCKRMRLKKDNQRPCDCGGYHHPHRTGSPRCASNPNSAALIWAELDRPIRRIA